MRKINIYIHILKYRIGNNYVQIWLKTQKIEHLQNYILFFPALKFYLIGGWYSFTIKLQHYRIHYTNFYSILELGLCFCVEWNSFNFIMT